MLGKVLVYVGKVQCWERNLLPPPLPLPLAPYRHLDGLHGEVTGWLEGCGPRGVPVGGDSRQGSHAHERVGGQAAHILPHVTDLGHPQLSQEILGLHGVSSLSETKKERERNKRMRTRNSKGKGREKKKGMSRRGMREVLTILEI